MAILGITQKLQPSGHQSHPWLHLMENAGCTILPHPSNWTQADWGSQGKGGRHMALIQHPNASPRRLPTLPLKEQTHSPGFTGKKI